MSTAARRTAAILVLACSMAAGCASQDASQLGAEKLAGDARAALTRFEQNPGTRPALQSLSGAAAIIIFPLVHTVSTPAAGSAPLGLLFVNDTVGGGWRGPAFYRWADAGIGQPANDADAAVLMIVNSQDALRFLAKGRLRPGVDASVAVDRAIGVPSDTRPDIDIHALQDGPAASLLPEGSTLLADPALDATWYDRSVTPQCIILGNVVPNLDAGRLISELNALSHRSLLQAARKKPA